MLPRDSYIESFIEKAITNLIPTIVDALRNHDANIPIYSPLIRTSNDNTASAATSPTHAVDIIPAVSGGILAQIKNGHKISSSASCCRSRTHSDSSIDMGHLRHRVNTLINASLANSTKRTYKAGMNSYIHFCKQIAHIPFPFTEKTLLLFVAAISSRLAFKTIKIYLCAIQQHAIIYNHPGKISEMLKLQYTL